MVWVLDEDPELGHQLAPADAWEARQRAVARMVEAGAGTRSRAFGEADAMRPQPRGLLVLSGMLLREVAAGPSAGSVLVGPGDLVWEGGIDEPLFLPPATCWSALTDIRLAVIDAAFLRRVAPWPRVTLALLGRAGRHAEMLALQQAVTCQVRVEDRVMMLMVALADRWGRVGTDGVRLDVPLTVTALAELVAAQRQTVSTAVARLRRQGLVEHSPTGWIVRVPDPDELGDERPGMAPVA